MLLSVLRICGSSLNTEIYEELMGPETIRVEAMNSFNDLSILSLKGIDIHGTRSRFLHKLLNLFIFIGITYGIVFSAINKEDLPLLIK